MTGIGTDILKISRLQNTSDDDDPFIQKAFTPLEREEAKKAKDPVLYYAARFACKEAVFKTLGENEDWLRPQEIEITKLPSGQPQVTLYGELKRLAGSKGIKKILISLSFDTEYVIAFAMSI